MSAVLHPRSCPFCNYTFHRHVVCGMWRSVLEPRQPPPAYALAADHHSGQPLSQPHDWRKKWGLVVSFRNVKSEEQARRESRGRLFDARAAATVTEQENKHNKNETLIVKLSLHFTMSPGLNRVKITFLPTFSIQQQRTFRSYNTVATVSTK